MSKKSSAHTHGQHEHSHEHAHGHHHHEHGPEHYQEHCRHQAHCHGEAHEPRLTKGASVLTLRANSGVSGDMMLGGLAALAGLDDQTLSGLTAELGLPTLKNGVRLEERSVNAISGVGCKIELPHEHAHRTLADIEKIIGSSTMPDEAKELSAKAFRLLAEAEGAVHGKAASEVSFHEVGALDSILDTCLACRIFTILKPDHFICSPLPMADGVINCAHGLVHSPAPAVLRLLEGVPICGFSGKGETVTPTALSLLKALGANFGPWPRMTVRKSVISYGDKIFEGAPNGALWILGEA